MKFKSEVLLNSVYPLLFSIFLTCTAALKSFLSISSFPAKEPLNNTAVRLANKASFIPFSDLSEENTNVRGRANFSPP